MTAPGHILLASAIVGITDYIFHIPIDPYFLVGVTLGALLPDIDEPKSLIGQKLAPLAFLLRIFNIKHRTLSHSVLFAVVFILPSFFLPYPFKQIGIGIGIGSILHCVGDLLTISGLKYFLFPLEKDLHLLPQKLRFRTGGMAEQVIIIILAGINYIIYTKLNLVGALSTWHPNIPLEHFLETGYYYFLHFLPHYR